MRSASLFVTTSLDRPDLFPNRVSIISMGELIIESEFTCWDDVKGLIETATKNGANSKTFIARKTRNEQFFMFECLTDEALDDMTQKILQIALGGQNE